MFLIDITGVKALPNRWLELEFADNTVGKISLDHIVEQYDGIFSKLMDQRFFEQVRVDPELGTIVWPNGADLCPDVLYAHITGQQEKLQAGN